MIEDINVTIEDVAKEAMVSVATVSRVVNESGRVSETTARRVREAIEKLGYVPNPSARNLRKGGSKVVLIMVPNFTNPYYSQILSGICDAAQFLGYSAFISSDKDANQEKIFTSVMEGKRADGTIFLTCCYDDVWLGKYVDRFPIVQCAEAVDNVAVPYISIDNYAAMCELVRHVRQLGHEKIAYVNIENRFLSTRQRKQGYCDSMTGGVMGKSLRSDYIIGTTDYSYESGVAAAERLMSLPDRPTAILCGSDMLALGVVSKARELGISVPGELSVTGFDDIDYAKMFHPYITTVAQPCYELGWTSMQKLKECIDKNSNDNVHIIMPHKLKLRETTDRVANG